MSQHRVWVATTLWCIAGMAGAAEEFQFNTDVLDIKEQQSLDLSLFSRANFILPGQYSLLIQVNRDSLSERTVQFIAPQDDPKGSLACISAELVNELGLKAQVHKTLAWWHEGACLDISSIPGMQVRGDLGTATLYVSIPQESLEYTAANWDPPSRWEDGINGALLDYNFNAQTTEQLKSRSRSNQLSGNGTAGFNLGAWRLRGDWQAQMQQASGQQSYRQFDWSRFYALRAVPSLGSNLALGEDYLNSTLFGSFRFTGASLATNDSMLPPNLRGYAPEIAGVARTNARVVVRQLGRVLYDTQVPPGPFRIQDLNDAVSGKLDVQVEEQDGSHQEFQVDTASIPYLTRPGTVRYRLAAGKPSEWDHSLEGPAFASGEFSWGVSNGWSLYGGGLGAKDYGSVAVGVGRDLLAFGALSVDVTQSRAQLPQGDSLMGKSYRTSYSKRFEDYDSQVTFAGYRFSEEDFMSMNEFIDARRSGEAIKQNKEMYTASVSKNFRDQNISLYLDYHHQTYWNSSPSDRYSLSLSRYFNLGNLKNLSLSLTAYRNQVYGGSVDEGAYLSVSLPWGERGSVSYSSTASRNATSHNLSYFDRVDERNSYMLSAGTAKAGNTASGYLTHEGSQAQVVASASYQTGQYRSAGLAVQGGATLTAEGGALHRSNSMGGTRILVDTQGVPGVPVRGSGAPSRTNRFGKAVITDVNSYYRNQASIDLGRLADDVEATQSVTEFTLTEGAIGYRSFGVIAGHKAMVRVLLTDDRPPPFGSTVRNSRGQETGIISEDGLVYLSGMQPGEAMTLHWDGKDQCRFVLPETAPVDDVESQFLCRLFSDANSQSPING
ncbi:outer membrane usher protein PapC [Pseudomonas protegens]|uniref:outer membrane usher protein n=1 Tax=Pseudomonas protegens TaxID=380021 RepID=UPI0021C92FAC|nr:outer membrane usher protein [Pseudomonas protegens]MCU1764303.1 outer membrane usher protein [Pseudomonas protegens]